MPPAPAPPATSPATDEALLHRFARGETAALGLLAERYEHALLGLARAVLSGRADLAADAVQESWVRVIKHAKGFAGQASVKTWLYRIVINRCKDLRDAHDRQLNIAHRAAELTGCGEGGGDGGRWEAAPAHPSQAPTDSPSEANAALRAAIDTLPDASRLLLLLCYHHDLTHPQVAEILGIPLGTVKSRLSAALAQLRAQLREEAAP